MPATAKAAMRASDLSCSAYARWYARMVSSFSMPRLIIQGAVDLLTASL